MYESDAHRDFLWIEESCIERKMQAMAMASGHHENNAAAAGVVDETRVIGIQELVDDGLLEVPPIYVRPPHERPCFSPPDDNPAPDGQIPVIDVAHLVTAAAAENHDERSRVVEEIGRACEEWGFFQVINHGIEPVIIQRLRATALQFFAQTAEERMRFHSTGAQKFINYSTSFNPKAELVREWRDVLSFQRYPLCYDGFQEAPDICKEPLLEYVEHVEVLAERLYKAIFESLGLDEEYIETKVPKTPRLIMGINYYPPCPDPSLALGLSSHSDVGCLTILHPSEVPGLQIKKGESWVPVIPIDPNAFVINLADQIEILSNGKYKSIEHRVVTNGKKARMSMACFFGPTKDTIIAPLPKLLHEKNPPFYKPTRFHDYFQNFITNRLLPNRGTLEFARV